MASAVIWLNSIATKVPSATAGIAASATKPSRQLISAVRRIGTLASDIRPSPQPLPDPFHRLAHVGGGAGIAEAQEFLAVQRVEIEPRRRRHARLFQHA